MTVFLYLRDEFFFMVIKLFYNNFGYVCIDYIFSLIFLVFVFIPMVLSIIKNYNKWVYTRMGFLILLKIWVLIIRFIKNVIIDRLV